MRSTDCSLSANVWSNDLGAELAHFYLFPKRFFLETVDQQTALCVSAYAFFGWKILLGKNQTVLHIACHWHHMPVALPTCRPLSFVISFLFSQYVSPWIEPNSLFEQFLNNFNFDLFCETKTIEIEIELEYFSSSSIEVMQWSAIA